MNFSGQWRRVLHGLSAVFIAVALSACASAPLHPTDPYEDYNRAMFKFNERLDKYTLRPIARVYDTITPSPIKAGVGNFFGNLGDVWIGIHNILQGKLEDGLQDWMRVICNSTFGILGLIDVATAAGIPKHDEDFGQTLAVWGVGDGPFVVLPFFGPRTLRDAVALPLDITTDNVWGIDGVAVRNSMTGLRLTHNRAGLLGVQKTLDQGTLDKYAYTRDFYLQQRRYKVTDGNLPVEYDDFDDVPDEPASGVDSSEMPAAN